jgi:hypothetical protein
MPDEMNMMDPDEFRELGLLHEVNRRLLHPCGLALAMHTGFDYDEVERIAQRSGVDPAAAWSTVCAFGLNKMHFAGVWDCRDDLEGIVFAPDAVESAKVASVAELEHRHAPARLKRFGWVIQRVPRDE